MKTADRGVSEVISVILLVAIVLLLATTVSVTFLGVVEDFNEPAPRVADSTGEFEPELASPDNQIVRITHAAGESVAVEDVAIIVRASGPDVDTKVRFVNLPAEDTSFDAENFADGDPDNLIDDGDSTTNNVIISDGIDRWSAGQTITFRINTGTADFREDPNGPEADELEVLVVHTPSEAIISRNEFTPS